MIIADKVDGTDSEAGVQEDDSLIQDEIYKSRLACIKRVCLFLILLLDKIFVNVVTFSIKFPTGGRNNYA